MRLLTSLSLIALLAAGAPAIAQDTTTNTTTEAPANTTDNATTTTDATATDNATTTTTDNATAPANDAAPANTTAPANEAAPANAVARAPNPEGVSDEADRLLWCGEAFSTVSEQVRTGGDTAAADEFQGRGEALTAQGQGLLTDVDEAGMATLQTGYDSQVAGELAGDGSNARYSYDECMTLPVDAAAAPANGAAPANDAAAGNTVAPANDAAPAATDNATDAAAPAGDAMAPANDAAAADAMSTDATAPANEAPAQ